MVSCAKMSDVNSLVDKQAARIDKLEGQVAKIETLVNKLAKNVSVTNVEKTADGYTLSFSDGTTAVIKNGEKGDPGEPGEDGEDGKDGNDGDAYFSKVELGDEFITITFNDAAATVVKLPLYKGSLGITSITYVPEYSDGVARIQYTTAESARLDAEFMISPAAAYKAVKAGVADKSVKVSMVYTTVKTKGETKSVAEIAPANLSFNDEFCIIKITNYPAAEFVNKTGSFAISVSEGEKYGVTSEFVFVESELVKCEQLYDVVAHGGHNRVQIAGVFKYGLSTTKCVVTWTPGDGRQEFPVERKVEEESFECIVADLAEGTYEFTVTTYDKDGNASDPTTVTGTSYGDAYASSLAVRPVASCAMDGDAVVIKFGAAPEGAVETKVAYTDADDAQKEAVVEGDVLSIESWKSTGEYTVSTYYLPEEGAIDTFAATSTGKFPDKHVKLVEKSGFAEIILDNDIALTAWAGALWKGWDGDKSAGNFAHSDNTNPKAFPFWYTFDMGQTCQLCKYVHFGNPTANRIFDGGSLKSWEIYGRADYPADSSWDGWTKLVSCESYKPSGSPVGTNTQEDVDRWLAGEEFEIPTEGLPQVRYIRVKVLDTWCHEGWMLFSEFEFYKYE